MFGCDDIDDLLSCLSSFWRPLFKWKIILIEWHPSVGSCQAQHFANIRLDYQINVTAPATDVPRKCTLMLNASYLCISKTTCTAFGTHLDQKIYNFLYYHLIWKCKTANKKLIPFLRKSLLKFLQNSVHFISTGSFLAFVLTDSIFTSISFQWRNFFRYFAGEIEIKKTQIKWKYFDILIGWLASNLSNSILLVLSLLTTRKFERRDMSLLKDENVYFQFQNEIRNFTRSSWVLGIIYD